MGFFNFFRRRKQPAPSGKKERRQVPRWHIDSQALIKWEGQDSYVPCCIKDINLKGFCVILARKLPATPVDFTISFHERYIIKAQAVPVHHEQKNTEHCYKMKFTVIRGYDKDKIYQMVRRDFYEHFKNQFK
ncbi:MAG: PilZ domain-containing protein [Candidatus Omnitrophica bacterium]|nr:PilZ domain-containing protein [Candidatus Omnitrophota bacterium]